MNSDTDDVYPTQVKDEVINLPVLSSERVHEGMVWNIVAEEVDLGSAGVVRREFTDHTGAVAILALDPDERVLLLRQYRHPVRSMLWELPAGLLDEAGEPWLQAAQRELAEEADIRARTWHTLADYYTSPGGSDEFIRIYLARDLLPVPEQERHERQAEEAGMVPLWVPLDDAVSTVLSGDLHNSSTAVGLLAAHIGRARGWETLRNADAAFELKSSKRSP